MKKRIINISYVIVFILIVILLFFYLNSKNKVILEPLKSASIQKTGIMHNGKDISEILNEDNYKKVGIDPNKYATFSGFLDDFKSFSGVEIDPVNENFSIGINNNDGTTSFVPFRYQKNKEEFEDKTNKNLAILDIYQAYKEGGIYGGAGSSAGKKIIFEDEKQNPNSLDLKRIWGGSLNVYKAIKELEKRKEDVYTKELLGYLYDFTGDYKKANETKDKLCKKLNDCEKININLTGKIIDQNKKPIQGAKIQLLNDSNFYSISDKEGNFKLDIKYFPFSHLRFKASLNGYSDSYNTYSLNYIGDNKNILVGLNFYLNLELNPEVQFVKKEKKEI